jgi:hypothetical protein
MQPPLEFRYLSHRFTSLNITSWQCSFPRDKKYGIAQLFFAMRFGPEIFFLIKFVKWPDEVEI